MSETASEYYARRAAEARTMAAKASDISARQAHEVLAAQYERMASGQPAKLNMVAS